VEIDTVVWKSSHSGRTGKWVCEIVGLPKKKSLLGNRIHPLRWVHVRISDTPER
jgi:hypothetical protein